MKKACKTRVPCFLKGNIFYREEVLSSIIQFNTVRDFLKKIGGVKMKSKKFVIGKSIESFIRSTPMVQFLKFEKNHIAYQKIVSNIFE